MKLHFIEPPFGKNNSLHKKPAIVLAFVIVTIIPVFHIIKSSLFQLKISSLKPLYSYSNGIDELNSKEECDLFSGEWIPNPNAPYYTNSTCLAIHEHQNCMKYGKPNGGFMQWRWKPDGCELPIFNPYHFLELMRDKSLAFVGDSLSRNQMESLICLLSRVETLTNMSYTADKYLKRLKYTTYNFTITHFWTPNLIKSIMEDDSNFTRPTHLYLDEYDDQEWTSQIDDFDYLLISSGHWFFRPMIFHQNKQIIGCYKCNLENVTDLGLYYGYRMAFRTAFKAIKRSKKFKGMVILRTYSPPHYENGKWNDKGADCVRLRPFKRNETQLEGENFEFHKIQIEELRDVEKKIDINKKIKFRILDATKVMIMRPDGHPSRYGRWPDEKVRSYNDCVHWCLPGPIDSLNDFLLEILKRESESHQLFQ